MPLFSFSHVPSIKYFAVHAQGITSWRPFSRNDFNKTIHVSSQGQPTLRAHFKTSTCPLAAAQYMKCSFHGYLCARIHCSTCRCPFKAAHAHVCSSTRQPFSCAHCSTVRCPFQAAHAQNVSWKEGGPFLSHPFARAHVSTPCTTAQVSEGYASFCFNS